MKYACITDPGKVRNHNEDSVIALSNDNNEYLLAVADGMGGHKCGEVASMIAVENLTKRFKEKKTVGNKDEAIKFIKDTVSEINVLIYEYTKKNPESIGMGTTLVIGLKTDDFLLFGNIGDSSGYVYKNKKIHKMTVDHTLVGLMVKSGDLSEEKAKEHPSKHVLMRALGAATTVEMDIFNIETEVDGILLCSDGLTNMLTDEQIEKVLDEKSDCETKLEKLVNKCNNRGGNDNISIAFLTKEAK